MKFDTIIIGGGLSGLVCGIRLSQRGQRCVIVSLGQSALHFSSGSYDLLNVLPNGEPVTNPLSSIKKLIELSPNHPYAKLGENRFIELVGQAEQFFRDIDLPIGRRNEANHYRVTPMGTLKPTWLTNSDFATSNNADKLPWDRVAIFNPSGFLDFYPQFIADEFLKMGTESDIFSFTLPDLDYLRQNRSELRSTNIARVLDKKENLKALIEILNEKSKNCDAIIFPACVGLDNSDTVQELKNSVNIPIHFIPTLPPSIVGIRTQRYLHDYFVQMGGVYMLGDSIKEAEIENNNVTKVYSHNHGDIPFIGKDIVLSTGSYFSQGLIATHNSVYEPIFNLDVSYLPDRQQWYSPNMFEAHGYQSFGVKTDKSFNGLRNGVSIKNLYVSGAILEGFNPVKEGSGAGVSILSALHVADSILSK